MIGNYMGFIDIEGKRYFDVREMDIREITPLVDCLHSDSRLRIDSMALHTDVVLAQSNKEELERLQRKDRENREAAHKRRANGGPKYVWHYQK